MRVAALAIALCLATPAQAKPPVWVVRDADSTIVLFGSIHALPPGLDWAPPALTAALARAEDVWFEIPNDEAGQLASAQAATQKGLLPRGVTLTSRLDRRTAGQLARVAKSLGMRPTDLDPYRPWMAEVTLVVAAAAKAGASTSASVETQVAAATPRAARRRAFETPEQQVGLLADVSEREQIASLKETLKEIEEEPDSFAELVRLWMAADVQGIYRDAVAPLRRASPALYRRILADRNRAWAPVIEERLKGSGETVMVMGAAHFVGPDGLPALLRKRGLRVDGP